MCDVGFGFREEDLLPDGHSQMSSPSGYAKFAIPVPGPEGSATVSASGSRRCPSLSLLLRPGPFYVDLGSLGVLVAQDAVGYVVLYLVVAADLPVYDDGVVAVTELLI